jgi:23S rRNA pseudouridine1911/1915/1917 synthase
MENIRTITVTDQDASKRLDLFLTENLPGLTRSGIKNLIKEGLVSVDGRQVKAGLALKGGESVTVRIPPPPPTTLKPEDVPLDLLYEDADVLVVNKPARMPVHPGAGRRTGTLVNALIHYTKDLSRVGGPERPGVVHRLDMDTTGSIVIARNDKAHRDLANQFKEHTTKRKYVSLVWGQVKEEEGEIDLPIGRDSANRLKISTRTRRKRRAVTSFRVLKRYPGFTLLELSPETGRTHQIRVHLAAINHPVVGDQVYCKRQVYPGMPKAVSDKIKKTKRQLLHAATIGFVHPGTGKPVEFIAPMPEDMGSLLKVMDEAFFK